MGRAEQQPAEMIRLRLLPVFAVVRFMIYPDQAPSQPRLKYQAHSRA